MKTTNVFTVMSFDELMNIASSTADKHRSAMCAAFGHHFSPTDDAVTLANLCEKYIARLSCQLKNWQTLFDGLAPALADVRKEKREALKAELMKLSPEERAEVMNDVA